MSDLTKQQLKNELVSHGIDLPSPSARKSEYVRIYEKYVAPIARSRGDFSSDDEDLPVNDLKAQASLDSSQMVINGLDVTTLDDDELYTRLQDLGSPVGPIVDTTRDMYQKKLYVMMGGHLPDSAAFNGTVDQDDDEEYSDSEPEVVEAPSKTQNRIVTESYRTTTVASNAAPVARSYQTSQQTETRRRTGMPADVSVTDSTDFVYDPDLHTPSPRRSLRTVSSSTSESVTYRRTVNNGQTLGTSRYSSIDGKDVVDSAPQPGKVSSALRMLVKLLFLALLIAAALYVYQNTGTESPFKAIEEMARQALEAAAGEEGKQAPAEDTHHPPAPPPQQQPQVAN